MSPWLENWFLTYFPHPSGKGIWKLADVASGTRDQGAVFATVDEGSQHRGLIAAAAPDMCRALLEIETNFRGECGKCSADYDEEDGLEHWPDCALDAALTKAGLATQEQRDEARKKLGL